MDRAYVPAAGHDLLLPFYNPLWRLMRGEAVRSKFIRDAGIAAGQRILDVGCGTGSLAVQVAKTVPDIRVTALDPDPKALARAAAKASRAGVAVTWERGFSQDLPGADGSFDRVLSSFMFHHLELDAKRAMLHEARRVLCAGGELHLIDFARSDTAGDGALARWLHPADHLHDPRDGSVAELMRDAGFGEAEEVASSGSLFGRYAHVRAREAPL
jgi:ubiquinone/menaquinone biosynthesis C-methylase UbiE